MPLPKHACYRALKARDRRFDGAFFVGVKTTGIYCRPVCPARTPALARCAFFDNPAQAEQAGFRACFRCRPELAPGKAPVDRVPRLLEHAVARIDAGALNDGSLEDLAAELDTSTRHLCRVMTRELGVTPLLLAQSKRLALAKQLLFDTGLSLTDVAMGAGFSSIRRFNAAFRERFGMPPREARSARTKQDGDSFCIRLDYRPPFDWSSLLGFLRARAIAGVEEVTDSAYGRTVELEGIRGRIHVRDGEPHALFATISLSLLPKLSAMRTRLRRLFDLDASPHLIQAQLETERSLAVRIRRRPGLRIPGCFDPFEASVRAILGQQISVPAATTLASRFAKRFGTPFDAGQVIFPSAERIARVRVPEIARLGIVLSRARTIHLLANALQSGALDLSGRSDVSEVLRTLTSIPGIGPWTAQYIAMRALLWPDAFPASDLGIKKALGVSTAKEAEQRMNKARPWRAYAVMHLWMPEEG